MVSITINGETTEINADPVTPLLWVIRDELKFTGTKFGCGKGLCGACTVHLNGQAIRSCSVPVAAATNQEITTIEGLAAGKSKNPYIGQAVRDAWAEFNVPQCGYCQPGQIMSATALLTNNSTPSDADIDNAMSGNICRCGTYPRIRSAIKKAAEVQS